jgi:hypothetical protein
VWLLIIRANRAKGAEVFDSHVEGCNAPLTGGGLVECSGLSDVSTGSALLLLLKIENIWVKLGEQPIPDDDIALPFIVQIESSAPP